MTKWRSNKVEAGFLLLGILAALLWLWWDQGELLRPMVAVDVAQTRLDIVLPTPQGAERIRQPFVPQWHGLQEIELILARRSEPDVEENGRLFLRLYDDSDQLIAENQLDTRFITHNQTHHFRFPPQPSAQQAYVLEISGSDTNPVSVWGYSVNSNQYSVSSIQYSGDSEGALRFTTRYRLTRADGLRSLGDTLWAQGGLLLLALLFLPLPGVLLLQLGPARWRYWDRMAWWGVALALGTAVWPLLWFGLTLLGGRWQGWGLWLVVGVGWLSVIGIQYSVFSKQYPVFSKTDYASRLTFHVSRFTPRWNHLVLAGLLLLGLAVRLLAVRQIDTAAWVDAGRHALITAVMVESGQTISNYAPYLPQVERFPYHFGFHTLAASLQLLSGWPLPELLLYLGQLLNALVPLTVYAAVWLLLRQRGAALLAAFLVALPFFFPAYYATWGRLTQLTAVLILPVLLACTWRLYRGGWDGRRGWWLVGLLAAGLCLVHFRVFLYYLPFAGLVWLVARGRNGRYLLAAAALALLLTGPRLYQLAAMTETIPAITTTIAGYNRFPVQYYHVGWDRYFIWLAGGLWLALLPFVILMRRWIQLPLTLAAWVGLLFILLAGERLGLPETTLVNLNSMYIILFVPLAIFLGLGWGQLWRGLRPWPPLRWVASLGLGAGLTLAGLFGTYQQITILNPQTVLVYPQDIQAITWLDENLPPEAHIAVNSWRWLGNTWAGSDGGAWILPLAGRSVSTPPADYIYNRELAEQVGQFNEELAEISDWSEAETADWLRRWGVSHIFIGARGGQFDPAGLIRNPHLTLLYARDGVFIFALD
ncbi:MAG: hypothetical protein R6X32_06350 [Chloroflexota bacterium]